MSISGKEETGSFSWQSSNYSSGIPIKKRKYLMFRSPSPELPELPNISPTEAKISSPSHELDSSKVDDGASYASKSPVLNINEAITAETDVDLAGVGNQISNASQAQTLSIPLDSLHTREKLFSTGQQNMIGGNKLDSAQAEVSVESTRKNLPGLQQAGKDCTPELFQRPGKIELSLGPEEPLIHAPTADPDSKSGSEIPDKIDTSKLCLSLSQNNSPSGYKVENSMVSSASTYFQAKRSNWDLNTSMDAWEVPAGDSDSQVTVTKPCHMHDEEPMFSAVPKVVSEPEEQLFGVTRRNSDSPTSSHVDKYGSDDYLQLSLSTSAPTVFSVKQSNPSAQVNSGATQPNPELVEGLVSTRSTSSASCDTVKSEPFDETGNHRNTAVAVQGIPVKLPDQVNKGLMEKSITKAVISPNVSLKNVTEPMSIKSEPVQEGKEMQIISQVSVERVIPCQENASLSLTLSRDSRQPNESFPLGLFTCSKLKASEDLPNQLENTSRVEEAHKDKGETQVSSRLVDQVATGMLSQSLGLDSKELITSDGMTYAGTALDANADKPEKGELGAECVYASTYKNSDGFESDEENKNILNDILEEDAYRSDSASEGNHEVLVNLKSKHGGKEVDYEDGEVRDALMHVKADVAVDMEIEMINQDATDCTNAPAPDINDSKVEDHGDLNDNHMEEIDETVIQKATNEVTNRDCSLQESTIEETADRNDANRLINTTGRSPPVLSGQSDDREDHDRDELSDGATAGSRDNGNAVSQIATAGIEGTDTFEKVDIAILTESNLSDKNSGKDNNYADADKDGNSGGSRSRIINLSRASNMASPSEPRFMLSRPLSATERDRHTDFEEDRIPLRRNRSEYYNVPQNFDNDRYHDRSFRNSGTNFVRGRGRGRGFRQRIEWDSDRDFGADIKNYNPGSYRYLRYKCAGGNDAEFESNGYGIATSRSSGLGRGGSSSRHQYSRRPSPGATDGTGTRGTQMLRRFPGNANSSRSIGEHNSDFVGTRNGGKFTRGLPKDVDDSSFDHPRHVNEVVDDQFVGGSRNFSTSVQRRGPHRIRSKSPVSSRSRSPGQWPSRRRSSDNLIGLQELNQCRSPTTYRMDRTRSPDPCFSEEAMSRRGGSPPYVARPSHDLRNIESGSANPNRRRPYDRLLPESTSRRVNITDPRERRDDEFFRGPNYSGRYNDYGGPGRGDDRRKYGERRGRGRSFRPSFNGADGGTYRFNENGNRPFCPEADSKHIERGDLREREFDRRINYKTGISPSRTRNLEEGGNRRGGQVWHDDGFDDVPEMKRRKF
ncbi:hypothetical protein DCAR_0626167 [Daucus carota subsp. sativus]|uniref:Uncharacterized protein n=1 Tax=Daucus carota subsp. sativus TaxID=79200 RepID=A0AAF1B4W7_DAUCS|nr:PREDICTED: uncharacterized protein LOC108227429 [Daucus carota subsp. sativus]WOH06739.1 hypothetical protein DCAR_0626167 [Daucus carota subsp. sativus]